MNAHFDILECNNLFHVILENPTKLVQQLDLTLLYIITVPIPIATHTMCVYPQNPYMITYLLEILLILFSHHWLDV